MTTTGTAPGRTIEGRTPSTFATVERARELLHGGDAALTPLARDLAAGLTAGAGDVEVERYRRLLYATDASIYEMEPVAVVYPRSAADVQHVMRVAGQHGVPVLPRGGGTSLSGQTVNHAIVLDFTRHMAGVLSIDTEGQTARVQPGVVLAELNKALRPHGLQYPIDPSTANRATIGGGVGNNSCGAHSAVYGKTVDNVIALEVVLSDGSMATLQALNGDGAEEKSAQEGLEGDIYRGVRAIAGEHRAEVEKRFPKILRRVSGYNLDEVGEAGALNLAKVVVGSEGTLATVTEATVRVVPIPPVKMLTALHFRTVVDAAAATVHANAHGPSAVELVDDTIIERCRESAGFRDLVEFVEGEPGALLLVEFAGERAEEVEGKVEALRADLVGEDGAFAAVVAREAAEQQRMWRMREAGLGLLMSLRGDAKPASFVEDTAVAPERLAEYVAHFDALVKARGLRPAYYGHASVGCLHIRPIVDLKDAEGLANAEGLAEEIADLVLEFGGSLSGEHGDGIVRGVFTERMFGPQLTRAFRELKALWDPQGLLNPGKIVETPPFSDNLRLSPATVNAELHTELDFRFEGGLARAAEQCNGQGACRKLDGGMCPSFMVTGDEEHSTRGRANLLRQALNGALPLEDLTSERMHEALDLCVECKACKTECPSGVDFAKLKYEVQAQSSAAHGAPLRDRAFARIRTLSALTSPVAPLAKRGCAAGAGAGAPGAGRGHRWAAAPAGVRAATLRAVVGAARGAFGGGAAGGGGLPGGHVHGVLPPGGGAGGGARAGGAGVRGDGGAEAGVLRTPGDLEGAAGAGAGLGGGEHRAAGAVRAARRAHRRHGAFVPAHAPGRVPRPAAGGAGGGGGGAGSATRRAGRAGGGGGRGGPRSLRGRAGGRRARARALPPEGVGGGGRDAAGAGGGGVRTDAGGLRVLRDGGVVRVREGALRGLAGDGGVPALSGGGGGGRGGRGGGHGGVVPAADWALHVAQAGARRGAAGGGAGRGVGGSRSGRVAPGLGEGAPLLLVRHDGRTHRLGAQLFHEFHQPIHILDAPLHGGVHLPVLVVILME